MSKDSIRRAEREANKIMLNLGLAELRKHAGHSQSEIPGYRQSSVSKIEARKDMNLIRDSALFNFQSPSPADLL
jgi:hypothetical protein